MRTKMILAVCAAYLAIGCGSTTDPDAGARADMGGATGDSGNGGNTDGGGSTVDSGGNTADGGGNTGDATVAADTGVEPDAGDVCPLDLPVICSDGQCVADIADCDGPDAGPIADAGPTADAGPRPDAGALSDSGARTDSGIIVFPCVPPRMRCPNGACAALCARVDAGVRDAGTDAGRIIFCARGTRYCPSVMRCVATGTPCP